MVRVLCLYSRRNPHHLNNLVPGWAGKSPWPWLPDPAPAGSSFVLLRINARHCIGISPGIDCFTRLGRSEFSFFSRSLCVKAPSNVMDWLSAELQTSCRKQVRIGWGFSSLRSTSAGGSRSQKEGFSQIGAERGKRTGIAFDGCTYLRPEPTHTNHLSRVFENTINWYSRCIYPFRQALPWRGSGARQKAGPNTRKLLKHVRR